MSVLPSILGKNQVLDRKLYWEQYSGGFQQAVRWGKWKGIRRDGTPATFELYDLSQDIGETRDVSAANGPVVREIAAFMESAHAPSPNWSRKSANQLPASGKKRPADSR